MTNADDAHATTGATTLGGVLAEFVADGYGAEFGVDDETGDVQCYTCNHTMRADNLAIERSRRLEGASDPADMAMVLALACLGCGTKGTLVVRFGPEASAGEAKLLRALRDDRGGHDRGYAPDLP